MSVRVFTKDTADRFLWRILPRLLRVLAWTLAVGYFAGALLILALRHYVLPEVSNYRDDIAAAVSRGIGEKVTIGAIDADWYGLHPHLTLSDVRIHDNEGRVALSFDSVRASIGWSSLLVGNLRFSMLALDGPQLRLERDASGAVSVAGIEVERAGGAAGGATFADWLLRQDEILVSRGRVEWLDDSRAAPPLLLTNVEFRMVNTFLEHRFALRASPPAAFAAKIDLRGEFSGRTLSSLAEWTGHLYAGLDYVDLESWKSWVDYPFSVDAGAGALRAWLDVEGGNIREIVADVALDGVRAQFDRDLPTTELEFVRGRLGLRETGRGRGVLGFLGFGEGGEEVYGRGVTFGLQGGPVLRPTDFSLRRDTDAGGGRGELRVQTIDLEPLAALAESVPLTPDIRTLLRRAQPQGVLHEARYTWRGAGNAPSDYRAQGRFERVGMQSQGSAPGFVGLSGSFDVTANRGAVSLDAHGASLAYPQLFRDSVAERPFVFDSLAGRIGWNVDGDKLRVNFEGVSFASASITGVAFGNWESGAASGGDGNGDGKGRGRIDLTVRASHVNARDAYRYVPQLGSGTETWLKQSIGAGDARDLRMHLKGALADFPYDDPSRGVFELTMKVADGELTFAPKWPKIESIAADLRFRGRRMDILASSASTSGVGLARTRASIPDLFGSSPTLEIDGNADGPASEFVRYVNASPVGAMLGGITTRTTASGRARLALKFGFPLDKPDAVTLAGRLQLSNVALQAGPRAPALTQVSGLLGFSEKGVRDGELSLRLLGGATKITVARRLEDVATVTAQGTLAFPEAVQTVDSALAARMRGTATYRVHGTLRPGAAEIVAESTLRGIAVDLPAPFGKRADETWLTRVAWASGPTTSEPGRTAVRRDQIAIAIGNLARVQAQLRRDADRTVLERAVVGLGGVDVTLPPDRGVYVNARFASLDVDRLRAALKGDDRADAQRDAKRKEKREETSAFPTIDSLTLKADVLTMFGRDFHDVTVQARGGAALWQAYVAAREVNGDIRWSPEGKGTGVARLSKFALPPRAADPLPGAAAARDFPALDVIADNFFFDERNLGRLEMQAVNQPAGWRIDRLILTAPDGTAKIDGLWRPAAGLAPQRTTANFTVEAKDAGAFLTRFGYPKTVARGTATLNGELSWNGPVYAIDYPSLAGSVKLEAAKGQFLKAEPGGAARLLGVLSLQALPGRIVKLDFRDVFSDGFAFDSIKASSTIANGIASTSDFEMAGPAARVSISGTADLVRETQDLHVHIVPTVGDSLSTALGLALLNPALGIGAYLTQKILDDPLGQMLAREFRVSGTWADPKVDRIKAESPHVTEVPTGN